MSRPTLVATARSSARMAEGEMTPVGCPACWRRPRPFGSYPVCLPGVPPGPSLASSPHPISYPSRVGRGHGWCYACPVQATVAGRERLANAPGVGGSAAGSRGDCIPWIRWCLMRSDARPPSCPSSRMKSPMPSASSIRIGPTIHTPPSARMWAVPAHGQVTGVFQPDGKK